MVCEFQGKWGAWARALTIPALALWAALAAAPAGATEPAKAKSESAAPPEVLISADALLAPDSVSPCPQCAAPQCQDACGCVPAIARPCYTRGGVETFLTLFRQAAEKGVENATIRAFNAGAVPAAAETKSDCEHCKEAGREPPREPAREPAKEKEKKN